MSENIREEIKQAHLDSRRIIMAHARDESMSVAERRENVEIELDHFADQILAHFKSQIEQMEKPSTWIKETMDFHAGYYTAIRDIRSKLQ